MEIVCLMRNDIEARIPLMDDNNAVPVYTLPVIIAAGVILRFFFLGTQSVWLDEYTSIEVASRPLSEILSGAGFDKHTPPFYYVLLHLWFVFMPTSEFGLRSLSACLDVANIWLVWLVCSRQFSRQIAAWASLSYSLSAFAVYYAQEGRMYALLIFLVLNTYYLALRFRKAADAFPDCLLLPLVGIAGMYTHYYYALFLFALTLALTYELRSNWRQIRKWWLMMLAVGVAFLPWLRVIASLASGEGQTFRQFVFLTIPYTFLRFTSGYGVFPLNYDSKENLAVWIAGYWPGLSVYVLLFGVLLTFSLFRLYRSFIKETTMLLLPLCLPPVLALLVSLKLPMLSERYLTSVYPFFVILFCLGLAKRNGENLAISALRLSIIALFAFALIAYFMNPNFGKTQWKAAAQYIEQSVLPAGAVYVRPDFADGVLRYYLGARKQILPLKDTNLQRCRLLGLPEKEFWLVERGTVPSFKDQLIGCGYSLTRERLFPLENGLRIFYFIAPG
jgi:mannosyltransferase